MKKEVERGPWVPQIIAIIMLLWALNPENPYGYYVLLRVVLCAICAYLAVRAVDIEAIPWAWILGVTAVVYNPIVRIHLTRAIWSVVNIATVVLLAVSFHTLRKHRAPPRSGGRLHER